MTDEKLRQLNVRIPERLHVRLKVLAALSGKTMAEIVCESIEEKIENSREPLPEKG